MSFGLFKDSSRLCSHGHIHLTRVITNNLDFNGNKVDRSMSEHLKNSMKVKSSHMVPLLMKP